MRVSIANLSVTARPGDLDIKIIKKKGKKGTNVYSYGFDE